MSPADFMHHEKAFRFWRDFWGFGSKGEGSLLNANDRALSEQSTKSTQKKKPIP
ncbi:hypothetical protein [Helicobacter cinaedi]|uniref:hypothetical protein n=1 Tax=Helicobacter cinaedi TaxID=213 RepID=UPI0015F2707C|nr:hypothetical protein [Helicobacter cinaedi]